MLRLKRKITIAKKPRVYFDNNVNGEDILELLLLHKGYHVKEINQLNGMVKKRFVRGGKYVAISNKL